MATNVYAPKDRDLSKYGFRWCNKDCRWEARRNLDEEDAAQLAQMTQSKVEVTASGQSTFTVDPSPEDTSTVIEE